MNIISKIKLNYYNNLFQIYLKDNKNNDFISLFKKCCLGTDQMGDLAMNYIHSAIEMPEGEKIFNKNLMWINSFDLEDTTYINNFINFYLDGENYCLKTYPLFLSSQKKITNKFNQLTFEDFQKHSYYLQFLLSNFDNCSTKFINSSAAFFETSDGKMFTHPRLTSGYIYIIKDPNEIFKKLLYSLNNQADHALHKMLNFDQKPEKNNKEISEQYYILGNKCVKNIIRYNSIVEQRRIKKLKKIFSNKNISDLINKDLSQGEGMIFVLGLPRSGTTLTESILSTADNITSAGETTILGALTKKFQNADYDENLICKEDIEFVANDYARMIKALSSNKSKFIIDKMPGNYFNIGFILLSLPAAKIINLNRDPWDNATSLFQQHYITNIPYSSSFFNIGIHIANYEEVMKFWKGSFLTNQQNFMEISYKDLVTNTQENAKKIFDFCHLSGTYKEENRKGFFARTASKNQVTQGVYKSSLNKEIFIDFKNEFFESLSSQREYWGN